MVVSQSRLIGIGALFLLCISTRAQHIDNVKADFDGEKVILVYDLIAEQADDRFNVHIFSSHDNFQTPLSLVVGDAGENVRPGQAHRVTWDARSSLPSDFNKQIVFKVKATLVVSQHHPNRLDVKPLDFTAFKRGGIVNLEWNGGKEKELITIELLHHNEVVEKIAEAENTNMFSWPIPKKTKTGKDYTLRISKTANAGVQAVSQPFEIKPKLALWMKLLPLAVAGGVVAILSGGEESETPDLPGPITPGG